jgi:hypothetical protein
LKRTRSCRSSPSSFFPSPTLLRAVHDLQSVPHVISSLLQALLVYGLCLSSLESYFPHLHLNPFASQTPNLGLLDARHLDLPRPNPAVTDHNEFCENTNRPTVFLTRPRTTSTLRFPPLVFDLTNVSDLVHPVVAPPTSHPYCRRLGQSRVSCPHTCDF